VGNSQPSVLRAVSSPACYLTPVDLGLHNRIVLVSGSTRGIGRATAGVFLREGARVVVVGRGADSLGVTANSFRAEFGTDRLLAVQADLTSLEGIDHVVTAVDAAWGKVQVLVANIGSGKGTAGWRTNDEEWASLINTNLLGATRLVSAVLPGMIAASNGSIVLVSSIAGVESIPAPLAYSAAKAALVNYGKNLARHLGPSGVRVNVVAPGNVLFEGGSWDRRSAERPEETRRYIEQEVPLRRFAQPEEIASVVTFLASGRASFVTGACVVVDGGQTRSV
jgi:3-oxoacyl-[acyl-carrier protein] reductase